MLGIKKIMEHAPGTTRYGEQKSDGWLTEGTVRTNHCTRSDVRQDVHS
jgi:hypothetical protein